MPRTPLQSLLGMNSVPILLRQVQDTMVMVGIGLSQGESVETDSCTYSFML